MKTLGEVLSNVTWVATKAQLEMYNYIGAKP
jgi:hypothetical protein